MKKSICITLNTFRNTRLNHFRLSNIQLDLKYYYLGEQKIKNIREPIRSYWVLSLPGAAAAYRFLKAKMAVNKSWRNVVVASTIVFIIGAVSVIGKVYFLPKFSVDKASDQGGGSVFVAADERKAIEALKNWEEELKLEMEKKKIVAERKQIEDERKTLETKKKQEEQLKLEMKKQRIAAERKRIEEERKALEAKKRREEKLGMEMEKKRIADERQRIEKEKRALAARKKQLATIPNTASKSRDNGIGYHKHNRDNKYSLAVFPFCKSVGGDIKIKELKEFIDFIIDYTNNIAATVFRIKY